MSDRVREAFESLIEQMEEPPAWEELITTGEVVKIPGSEEQKSDWKVRRGPLVAVAAALVAVAALLPVLTLPVWEVAPADDPAPADALGWETVPIPAEVVDPPSAVWTGTELVFWGGSAYTPDTGSWRELPRLSALGSFLPNSGIWTGTEAIFCCGVRESVAVRGFDTFRKTSNAPFHLDSLVKSVWTGELMLIASEIPGVASYDPSSDAWELFAEPPVGFGSSFQAFWTGSELVVWTMNEIGIALDPETRIWRTLSDPPETILRSRYTHDDVAYTGTELIVWGASSGSFQLESVDLESVDVDGAMLDLATGEWMELPRPLEDPTPCECRLRGGQTMVWTGESLLISTSHFSIDADTNEPVLIAYHPDTNSWTYEGVSPLGREGALSKEWGPRAITAGDRLVLMSDRHLYISPPGWQPQGQPIPNDLLYAVRHP